MYSIFFSFSLIFAFFSLSIIPFTRSTPIFPKPVQYYYGIIHTSPYPIIIHISNNTKFAIYANLKFSVCYVLSYCYFYCLLSSIIHFSLHQLIVYAWNSLKSTPKIHYSHVCVQRTWHYTPVHEYFTRRTRHNHLNNEFFKYRVYRRQKATPIYSIYHTR